MPPEPRATERLRKVGRGRSILVMPEKNALDDVKYLFCLSGHASSLEIKVVLTPSPASSAHTYFYAGTTSACPVLTCSCAPARRRNVEPGPMWPDKMMRSRLS